MGGCPAGTSEDSRRIPIGLAGHPLDVLVRRDPTVVLANLSRESVDLDCGRRNPLYGRVSPHDVYSPGCRIGAQGQGAHEDAYAQETTVGALHLLSVEAGSFRADFSAGAPSETRRPPVFGSLDDVSDQVSHHGRELEPVSAATRGDEQAFTVGGAAY